MHRRYSDDEHNGLLIRISGREREDSSRRSLQTSKVEGDLFPTSANHRLGKLPRKEWHGCLTNRALPYKRSGSQSQATLCHDDFPVSEADGHPWVRWQCGARQISKVYVVQTNGSKFIQRCILMTTDPGDLVLDPTCGSGTTAYVAEQWGRRWITIDTPPASLSPLPAPASWAPATPTTSSPTAPKVSARRPRLPAETPH